jgi:hypothetical protein
MADKKKATVVLLHKEPVTSRAQALCKAVASFQKRSKEHGIAKGIFVGMSDSGTLVYESHNATHADKMQMLADAQLLCHRNHYD